MELCDLVAQSQGAGPDVKAHRLLLFVYLLCLLSPHLFHVSIRLPPNSHASISSHLTHILSLLIHLLNHIDLISIMAVRRSARIRSQTPPEVNITIPL